jgi:hypothetical protein
MCHELLVWRGPVHASLRAPELIDRLVSEAEAVGCTCRRERDDK